MKTFVAALLIMASFLTANLLRADSTKPTALVWNVSQFASTFWILDQLAKATTSRPNAISRAWQKDDKLDAKDKHLLERFAQIRSEACATNSSAHLRPDIRFPLGDSLLPPRTKPCDDFEAAFLGARDVGDAVRRAQIKGSDAKTIARVFSRFAQRVDRLISKDAHLDLAAATLQELANNARLDEFVVEAARFYGCQKSLPGPPVVDVLWAPDGFSSAFRVNNRMVIPISKSLAANKRRLAQRVGTIAHEFGHGCVRLLPDAQRQSISNRLFEKYGLLNFSHPNYFEEAVHTAVGNILFMQTRLPEYHDNTSYYAWESNNDYPDAIDTYARALVPIVNKHWGTANAYASVFLDEAIEIQAKTFGETLRHHTRVALQYCDSGLYCMYFDSMFAKLSRFTAANVDEFTKLSEQNPNISRWLLLSADKAQSADLGVALIKPLLQKMQTEKVDSCIQAVRRKAGSGYDIVVVVRDREAMRTAIIKAHQLDAIPVAKAVCL